MANIKLYVAIAIVTLRIPQQVQALMLVVLVVRTLYHIRRPQVHLDTDQDLRPVTSESHQSLEPAETTPALTRPPLCRRNSWAVGPKGLTSQPLSSERESDSSSDSEGYETAPENATPVRTMEEERALAYFDERLRQHRESVSSETSASPSAQTSLTGALQIREKDQPDAEEDTEMLRRRNIKMRDEGVRVNVDYSSQLTSLKPAPAPRPALSNAARDLRGGVSGATSSPSSSSSPPSSCPSTTPPLSGLQSPAPTPCGGLTGITTPEVPAGPSSALPTSGQADETLYRIDEKLLAIPADAVSRRLLRDGRAILHRRKRLPRSFHSVGGNSGQHTPSPAESGLRTSGDGMGYPCDMME